MDSLHHTYKKRYLLLSYTKSMKQDLCTRSQTCGDTDNHELSSKTCIKKKFRLFGIEVEPYENIHSNGEMGHNESVNSSTPTVSSSEREKLCMDEKDAARDPASMIFECQYCHKEFTNPHALGGHQNAHKKERMKKKRLEIQARKASIRCYLQHIQNNPFIYHGSTPFFYQEPQISSSPFNQNLGSGWYSTPSHLPHQKSSHTSALTSADQSAETRPEVIQPSRFSSSQQNYQSLDLYLGLR